MRNQTKTRHKISLALLLIVAGLLTAVLPLTLAAGSASLYIIPASGNIKNGNTIIVSVYEDSGSEPVNAVQANLTYSTSQLSYTGHSSSSAFNIEAENPSGNTGTLRFARGSITPRTGEQLVVTVTFKAVAGSGTAAVNFDGNSSVNAADGSGTNILGDTTGGQYSLTSSGSSTPPPPPPPPAATPPPPPAATPGGGSTQPPASSGPVSRPRTPASGSATGGGANLPQPIATPSTSTESAPIRRSGNSVPIALASVIGIVTAMVGASILIKHFRQHRLAQAELKRHFPFADNGSGPGPGPTPSGPTVINPSKPL